MLYITHSALQLRHMNVNASQITVFQKPAQANNEENIQSSELLAIC